MTADEIWNEIVSKFYEKISTLEREVQELWENFFSDAEFFGYSKLRGEIDSQRNIPIGSGMRTVPDIFIKDCSTGKDLFVVELKQHNLPFNEKFKDQLISYMRQCLLKVGILICNKIYIYYGNDDNTIHTEIAFEHGNPQGSKFIDLFRKGNFDENAVKAFIEQQQTLQSEIQAIRADLQRVSINNIIKQYYKPQYSEEAIEIALKDLQLSLSLGEEKKTPNTKLLTGIPKLPIKGLANDSPVKKDYKTFLIKSGYTQNVANSYASGITTVLKWEHLTWEELLQKITDIRQQYEPGNVKEDFGKHNHSTVLNALRRFDEFTNTKN